MQLYILLPPVCFQRLLGLSYVIVTDILCVCGGKPKTKMEERKFRELFYADTFYPWYTPWFLGYQ